MADISKIKIPGSTISYNVKDAEARSAFSNLGGIYAVIGTQAQVSNSWTGAIPISALYNGLTIIYWLPQGTTSGDITLNLTLSNNTTTGDVPVYYSGNNKLTGYFDSGSCIMLTYWGRGAVSVDGVSIPGPRWVCSLGIMQWTDVN